jgi:hypothetical protein
MPQKRFPGDGFDPRTELDIGNLPALPIEPQPSAHGRRPSEAIMREAALCIRKTGLVPGCVAERRNHRYAIVRFEGGHVVHVNLKDDVLAQSKIGTAADPSFMVVHRPKPGFMHERSLSPYGASTATRRQLRSLVRQAIGDADAYRNKYGVFWRRVRVEEVLVGHRTERPEEPKDERPKDRFCVHCGEKLGARRRFRRYQLCEKHQDVKLGRFRFCHTCGKPFQGWQNQNYCRLEHKLLNK